MAWDLMREFLQGFLGSAVSNQAPQFLQVTFFILFRKKKFDSKKIYDSNYPGVLFSFKLKYLPQAAHLIF